MTKNDAMLPPVAGDYSDWTSRLPLTEQRQRTQKTTKQLVDKATKTYSRILRRELKKLEKA